MSILEILLILFGLALGIFGTICEGRIQGKLTRAGKIIVVLLCCSAITSLISIFISQSHETNKYLSIIKQTNRLMYSLHLSDATLYFTYDLKEQKYAHIREALVSRFSTSKIPKINKQWENSINDEPDALGGRKTDSNIVGYATDEKGECLTFSLNSKGAIDSVTHNWIIDYNTTNTPVDLLIRKIVFNSYCLALLTKDPLESGLFFDGISYFNSERISSSVGLVVFLNEGLSQQGKVTYNPKTMKLSLEIDFANISGQSGNGRIISILDLPKTYVAFHRISDEECSQQEGANIWPTPNLEVRLSIGFFRSMRVKLNNIIEHQDAPILLSSSPLSCEQAGIKGLFSEEDINFATK
jgi:hypothetical protein